MRFASRSDIAPIRTAAALCVATTPTFHRNFSILSCSEMSAELSPPWEAHFQQQSPHAPRCSRNGRSPATSQGHPADAALKGSARNGRILAFRNTFALTKCVCQSDTEQTSVSCLHCCSEGYPGVMKLRNNADGTSLCPSARVAYEPTR
jgi:hypothetical protein